MGNPMDYPGSLVFYVSVPLKGTALNETMRSTNYSPTLVYSGVWSVSRNEREMKGAGCRSAY